MPQPLPYCGSAPNPAEILTRFNFDPLLILVLTALVVLHMMLLRNGAAASANGAKAGSGVTAPHTDARGGQMRHIPSGHAHFFALCGWLVASIALISPLCALSVALFSARVAQHMVLILFAAPLIAAGLPRLHASDHSWPLWIYTTIFFIALWFWHMPVPYDATFSSVAVYWTMHVTLFGGSVLLWRELMHHSPRQTGAVLAAGTLTFMHMGLLGATLALADRPMFQWHLATTQVWGMTPLQDQQLGGAIMWVPGIALFLWIAMRSISRLWRSIERTRPA